MPHSLLRASRMSRSRVEKMLQRPQKPDVIAMASTTLGGGQRKLHGIYGIVAGVSC